MSCEDADYVYIMYLCGRDLEKLSFALHTTWEGLAAGFYGVWQSSAHNSGNL
jgi:hypothetical protein